MTKFIPFIVVRPGSHPESVMECQVSEVISSYNDHLINLSPSIDIQSSYLLDREILYLYNIRFI